MLNWPFRSQNCNYLFYKLLHYNAQKSVKLQQPEGSKTSTFSVSHPRITVCQFHFLSTRPWQHRSRETQSHTALLWGQQRIILLNTPGSLCWQRKSHQIHHPQLSLTPAPLTNKAQHQGASSSCGPAGMTFSAKMLKTTSWTVRPVPSIPGLKMNLYK